MKETNHGASFCEESEHALVEEKFPYFGLTRCIVVAMTESHNPITSLDMKTETSETIVGILRKLSKSLAAILCC